MLKKTCLIMILALFNLSGCGFATHADADSPPRITVAEVVEMLDRNEEVLFLDTRSPSDWKRSQIKIRDARRVHSQKEIAAIIDDISRDRPIVTYCT